MRRALAVAVAMTLAAAPAVARAQSKADAARADAAFTEGKHLLEHGSEAEACARFAESKRLAPAIGVTLYLADCYQRLGKTASAWTEFRSAEALARAHKDKRAELARLRAQALEAQLARITVRVATSLSSADVTLDGLPLAVDAWGTAMPVDPGDHVVIAHSGPKHREFTVHVDADKPVATVDVDSLDEPAAPAEPPPTPSPASDSALAPAETPVPSDSAGDSTRLWASVGLLGVGVVGVGLGSVFGIKAISDRNASNAGPCNAADQCSAHGLSLRDDAINEARVSTIAFVVGAAGLGASAVVMFALPRRQQGSVAVSAAPLPGGAAALVRASF
jgi:serine/threonine-protein kinase